jgi:hypothetical protein
MMNGLTLARVFASVPRKFGNVAARKEFSALVPIEYEFPGYVTSPIWCSWLLHASEDIFVSGSFPSYLTCLRLCQNDASQTVKATYIEPATIESYISLCFYTS